MEERDKIRVAEIDDKRISLDKPRDRLINAARLINASLLFYEILFTTTFIFVLSLAVSRSYRKSTVNLEAS